ncbi:Dna2/Cas4 domain-containing protein [Candidatus Woesearchaeota archaeon]|nr:Dna2/Cas4 domain-containing protein [Candidatus Woesearchaeota archaeon]
MAKRIQSPSSMNTYKMCPRKYYYAYIKELASLPNIHQVRGSIAHTVLEKFFDQDVSGLTMENFEGSLTVVIQNLLLKEWQDNEEQLAKLGLSDKQRKFYFEETMLMLLNWLSDFCNLARTQKGSFSEIFKKITPIREQLFLSEKLQARGYVDAIEEINNELRIMDYKTSSSFDIDHHRLQLGVYCLLYQEKHGKLPDKAGIYFLKDKPKFMDVDKELLEFAKKEIELIHEKTESDKIEDYPKKKSNLCKYSTGQCEFYDICQKEE